MLSMILLSLALIGNICPTNSSVSGITGIRTSFRGGIQRVVFDITGENEPAFYVEKDKNILSLTLEAYLPVGKDIELKQAIENSRYIDSVQLLHLPEERELIISMELKPGTFEESLALPNPSRVVIDISKNRTGE
jgi:hypothetical protein